MTEQEWLTSTDPAAVLRFATHADHNNAWHHKAVSDRKLRLWACACARQVWHLLDERGRKAIEVSERLADGLATLEEFETALSLPNTPVKAALRDTCAILRLPTDIDAYGPIGLGIPSALQATFLRDICGNPFCRTCLCGAGERLPDCSRAARIRTPTVLAVARAAYEDRPGRVCKRCGGGRAWPKFLGDASDYGRRITDACLNACPDCLGTGHTEDGTLDPDHLAILADALEDAGADNVDLLAHLRGPGPHVRGCWCVDLLLGKE
jgi:hypothetical protein